MVATVGVFGSEEIKNIILDLKTMRSAMVAIKKGASIGPTVCPKRWPELYHADLPKWIIKKKLPRKKKKKFKNDCKRKFL